MPKELNPQYYICRFLAGRNENYVFYSRQLIKNHGFNATTSQMDNLMSDMVKSGALTRLRRGKFRVVPDYAQKYLTTRNWHRRTRGREVSVLVEPRVASRKAVDKSKLPDVEVVENLLNALALAEPVLRRYIDVITAIDGIKK